MARHLIEGVGKAGIVLDVKPQFLPHDVWSNGRNVRFERNRAHRMDGVQAVYPDAKDGVLWVGFATSNSTRYYLWSDGAKMYAYDGAVTTDITRASGGDYNSTEDFMWDLEMYNGFAILNNGSDNIQAWDPSSLSNDCIALPNWTSTHRAVAIRGFKSHLVAVGINKNGTVYPHMIKWSHPADPGALPSSWNISDPTLDAGEANLTDTRNGPIVNALVLGEYLYIYKAGAIHALSYVGAPKIFDTVQIPGNVGLAVKRSLVSVPSLTEGDAGHFFAAQDGFYFFNGSRAVPIWEDVFKNEILKLSENPYYDRSFAIINNKYRELWYCVPELGSEICTLAFVWNYVNNTYTIRELGGTLSIASGLNFTPATAQISQDQPFSDTTLFSDSSGFYDIADQTSRYTVVEACPIRDQLYYLDIGDLDYDEEPWEAYLERVALATLRGRGGAYYENYSVRKLCSSVIPKLYSGNCEIQVGAQEYEQDTVDWQTGGVLNTGQHKYDLPYPISGRFLGFRFRSLANTRFEFGGFDYELDTLGEY